MRIVIFGGFGNYGLTLAGLAIGKGHEVFLFQFPGTIRRVVGTPQKNYEPIMRHFELHGGKFRIFDKSLGRSTEYVLDKKVLRSIEEIPSDIDIFVIAYPSLLHESIGSLLKGVVVGKTILTFTDRFLGGYSVLNKAEALGRAKIVAVGATPITAFQDDKDSFKRFIYSNKKGVRIALYPRDATEIVGLLEEIIPGDYEVCDNLLELAFNCAPSNLHAPHDLLNVVRYEQAHEFTMFHEGFTEGVENLINAVSRERCAVADAFNIKAISFLEYEQITYGYKGNNITENRRLNPQLNHIPAPRSLYACKGIEDVVCALVPLSELAKLVQVDVPVINSLIEVWSCYLNSDLRKVGRTLESLGLAGKSPTEIVSLMRQ